MPAYYAWSPGFSPQHCTNYGNGCYDLSIKEGETGRWEVHSHLPTESEACKDRLRLCLYSREGSVYKEQHFRCDDNIHSGSLKFLSFQLQTHLSHYIHDISSWMSNSCLNLHCPKPNSWSPSPTCPFSLKWLLPSSCLGWGPCSHPGCLPPTSHF